MVEAIVRGECMRPVLITAGATRNPIDSMRHISANASGKTGAAIAAALREKASVFALVSPTARPHFHESVMCEVYGSTDDLCSRMKAWVESHPRGVVVHSAAVGDYEAVDAGLDVKLPSGQHRLTIHLQPTVKILDQLRCWSPHLRIVSFKAASPGTTHQALIDIANKQRIRSESDLVFANVIGDTEGAVAIIDSKTITRFPNRSEGIDRLIRQLTILVSDSDNH